MICKTLRIGDLEVYQYVVVLSVFQGKILLSRHRHRTTWETQGGRIEQGETPLEAARRELYEESGALRYDIVPLCDYLVGESEDNMEKTGGRVFRADIHELGPLPESEMEEVGTFETLPDNLTYPSITPVLFAHRDDRFRNRILFATGNPGKLSVMRHRLAALDLEIVGLKDLDREIPRVLEDGNTPLENAVKKAREYYRSYHMPLFSCDSALYLEGIPEALQPGVHVRRVNGRNLSDEEMLSYYSGLAKKYGDLRARYRNAICLVIDEDHIYEVMDESIASKEFLITSRPHAYAIREEGFPLDCLSVDIRSGKYFYDLEGDALGEMAVRAGVLSFFRKALLTNESAHIWG